MTVDQRQELKQDIQKRILGLKESIKNLKTTSQPVEPDVSLGRLTRMDAIQIQKMQEANLSSSLQTLNLLEKSLEKIDDETFGMCQYCRKPIGFERIKAIPHTNKCIKCAEKFGM